ncbi:MAG: SIS domain-containing protein [Spirochaetes bacterium]|nr:SIS domain-containing protein [Spirochaetota bacterium]
MTNEEIADDLVRRYPPLSACRQAWLDAMALLKRSYEGGGKLLTCGNGGSASDAEHIVGELLKGFRSKRLLDPAFAEALRKLYPADAEAILARLEWPLPAVALTSHLAFTTAFGNDNQWVYAYAQQLLGLGKAGDALLAISTSGNSKNVVAAAQVAKARGIATIGLTGSKGGRLAEICDVTVKAPADAVYLIQEFHLPIYHAICFALEERFFPGQRRDA